jgi:hypothetical protein
MLTWTRELPIAGEPADVVSVVDSYARWLSTSPIPKLFIDAGTRRLLDRRTTRVLPRLA